MQYFRIVFILLADHSSPSAQVNRFRYVIINKYQLDHLENCLDAK